MPSDAVQSCCGCGLGSLFSGLIHKKKGKKGKKGKKKEKDVDTTPEGNPLPETVHVVIPAEASLGRRTIVIGDVHGCREDLELLVGRVSQPGDIIVLSGDTCGKGPDVPGAIRYIVDHGIMSVRGNHDDRGVRIWREWVQSGAEPPADYAWVKTIEPRYMEWLVNLPFSITIEGHGVLVMHGGMVPGVPLEFQDLEDLYTIRDVVPRHHPRRKGFDWQAACTALRLNALAGVAVPADLELSGEERPKPYGRPWSAIWQGPYHVLYGHASSRSLAMERFATGVDTACVTGGFLTAIVLPALDNASHPVPDNGPTPPGVEELDYKLFDGMGVPVRIIQQPSSQGDLETAVGPRGLSDADADGLSDDDDGLSDVGSDDSLAKFK